MIITPALKENHADSTTTSGNVGHITLAGVQTHQTNPRPPPRLPPRRRPIQKGRSRPMARTTKTTDWELEKIARTTGVLAQTPTQKTITTLAGGTIAAAVFLTPYLAACM